MATPDPNANPLNTNLPPPPPTPQNVHVHFPNNPVPKFNGDSETFITWKACMLKYIAGVERNLTSILKDGPYVPYSVSSVVLNADGTQRQTPKVRDHWSEEDHRLVDLDTKLQNMILAAVPASVIPTLVLFESSKSMWEELLTQYEGTTETLVNRKVALNKKYESFFALPDESLTGTYIRFSNLVNQLRALGVTKDPEILLEKFCDILPSKWENLILVLRQGKTLHSHTLNSLYGAFKFTEENKAERVMAERDAKNHVSSSSHVVQYTEPQSAALLSSESDQSHSMKRVMSELMNSEISDNLSTGCDEDDNDDLVAMIAKTFNRFKAKSFRSSGPNASSSSTDKTNLTCFKCGRKGHFMKECRSSYSKPQSSPSSSSSFQKSDDGYKSKYKKLKAQIALMTLEKENKCLMAKTEKWEDSEDSSDDEEIVKEACFMALDDQKHLVKDDIDSGRWVNIIMKKVSVFGTEPDQELKMDLLVLLNCDLSYVETVRSESIKLFDNYSSELSASQKSLKELKDVHLALKSQQLICANLEKEKHDLLTILEKEQKVIKSWMTSSNIVNSVQCALPNQQKAYLSGDLHLASIITDVHELPNEFRPDITFKNTFCTNTEAVKDQSEVRTEVVQTTTPVKKTTEKKSLPQSSSQKKKNVSLPEPSFSTSEKAQVSTEGTILSRLENQFQLLSRQVQSCNARLNNLESNSCKPIQNAKPFSKAPKDKSEKKKVDKSSLQTNFVFHGVQTSSEPSSTLEQKSLGTSKGESSEPISRWVPKNN
jgi:gag-polypeptide of LTR copia-type/Zinc knuckle